MATALPVLDGPTSYPPLSKHSVGASGLSRGITHFFLVIHRVSRAAVMDYPPEISYPRAQTNPHGQKRGSVKRSGTKSAEKL